MCARRAKRWRMAPCCCADSSKPYESELIASLREIVAQAPFRRMFTPGGHQMSVAMTNCGDAGWVTDHTGYRYDGIDPNSAKPWPAMPPVFRTLAETAASEGGFAGFSPDACLINRYVPGARMSLHQDRNENDFGAPIVSVSLGLPATFLFGGPKRADKTAALPAGAWRRRGLGRAVAAVLPRRRPARRRRARRDGPPADQSDVPQGALTFSHRGEGQSFHPKFPLVYTPSAGSLT